MKTLLSLLIIAVALVSASCGANNTTHNEGIADTAVSKTAVVSYTCTMHPEVVSEKPGKCPKCGMALVEKKADTAVGHKH